MAKSSNARALFERNINKTDGCWLWNGLRTSGGYGRFPRHHALRLPAYAHRAAWVLYRGPIPDGLEVCHRCDVPACVNPEHLFLGTPHANHMDAVGKGRKAPHPPIPQQRTHCVRGHELRGPNLLVLRGARLRRVCRECDRLRHRKAVRHVA